MWGVFAACPKLSFRRQLFDPSTDVVAKPPRRDELCRSRPYSFDVWVKAQAIVPGASLATRDQGTPISPSQERFV